MNIDPSNLNTRANDNAPLNGLQVQKNCTTTSPTVANMAGRAVAKTMAFSSDIALNATLGTTLIASTILACDTATFGLLNSLPTIHNTTDHTALYAANPCDTKYPYVLNSYLNIKSVIGDTTADCESLKNAYSDSSVLFRAQTCALPLIFIGGICISAILMGIRDKARHWDQWLAS